jgi:hypothetical protein
MHLSLLHTTFQWRDQEVLWPLSWGHFHIGTEAPLSLIPKMNGIAVFICAPWDRKVITSGGQPRDVTTGILEQCS